MSNNHNYCIILAGGVGSRFWPISRAGLPKQFLDFSIQGRTFLRRTYDRMKAIIPEENILVVSLDRYRDLVRTQLPELPEENLLLEPYNRNTAPGIAFATYEVLQRDPDAVTVVTPSDHAIARHDIFNQTLLTALSYAAGTDALITLGVIPTRPDPNFGYIQMAGAPEEGRPVKVKTFTEKPDSELARVFLETGEFLWNSGIFLWRADAIRKEIDLRAPEIARLWDGWQELSDPSERRIFLERIYTEMPRISIDYAVMEKTDKAWVYPAAFRWADIGNWESLYEYLAYHDDRGNALNRTSRRLLQDSNDNIVYCTRDDKLLAIRGMDNFIVIDTDDVLMICPRDEEKLKEFLLQLAMPEYEDYR